MGKHTMGKAGKVTVIVFLCGVFGLVYHSEVQHKFESVFPPKYRENTTIHTVTKRYTYNAEAQQQRTYKPCLHNCPWETYLSNREFKQKVSFRNQFSVDDDQQVTAMRTQLACVPFNFGYSLEKGTMVFPPYTYPPCSALPSPPRPTVALSNTSFTMECPGGLPGRFLLHPVDVPLTGNLYAHELERYWTPQNYTGSPVDNRVGEFAVAACGAEFNQAVLTPVFRPKVYQRAKETMENRSKGGKVRPISVVFISVDSFSRRHFYRKMTETVKTLNRMNKNKVFSVFDFKVHNVVGINSPINMVPMFTNQTLKEHTNPPRSDLLGQYSLWSIAKRWGFVTFLGFEYCGSNFIEHIGKQLEVDHHVSTFYCAANTVSKKTYIGSKEQRCLGEHMTHWYLLNYTRELGRAYKGVNQFVYIHLNAAHEQTGQHAQTLDNDLATFIQQYTADYGKDSDLAIMIQGDHGMSYGNWLRDIEADQEFKLPAMFLIAQTEFLDRIPNSFDALWHNTHRLVSKRDFRATVLSLFGEPYGGVYPVHEEKYLEDAYILTREKVKDSRVCNETHIDPWLCSCLEPTEEIPPAIIHSFGLSPVEKLLNRIVAEAVRIINEKVFTSYTFFPDFICQKVTIDEITRAYGYKINNKIEQIKVEFTINELSTARIETIALVGSDDEHTLFRRDFEWYPLDPYTYLGFPANIRVLLSQVIDITRKDKYAGPCEKLSRENGVDGEFCVCKDLAGLASDYPSLFDK